MSQPPHPPGPPQPQPQPEPQPPHAHLHVPDDAVEGTYADFVSVWHSRDVFVLDFAVLAQPVINGQLMSRVVSRVRIPPSQVFEIMKALEQQLTSWEAERAAEQQQQQPPGD
jgi:hypothetical protein